MPLGSRETVGAVPRTRLYLPSSTADWHCVLSIAGEGCRLLTDRILFYLSDTRKISASGQLSEFKTTTTQNVSEALEVTELWHTGHTVLILESISFLQHL